MKMLILAAIAALGLGMASVHAATTPHSPASSHHWDDGQNYMGGGGGS
jgi:hypothetical protein